MMAKAKRDFYESLGISKSASDEEIKKAYRTAAKKYHPDVNKAADATDKFKEIQEAYDVLSDQKKKQLYDQYGHAGIDPQAGFGGGGGGFEGFGQGFDGVDIGDIFNSFFGGGQRGGSRRSGPIKGNDKFIQMPIEFNESVFGKETEISVIVDTRCEKCDGSGARSASDIVTCSRCNGSGVVMATQNTPFGAIRTQTTCNECQGKGKTIRSRCETCSGQGYNKKKTNIDVKIPAGIAAGQQLRVSGKGDRGMNGGPNGDLYIEIDVNQHPIFKRDGKNIHMELPLSFPDAALGIEIDVPTVYGDVSLKVPEGIQDGQILRVKEKGFKDLRGGTIGDQFVHIKIEAPTKLNKEEKALYEQLRNIQKKAGPSIFDKIKKKFKN
jgi:molecular chaperone DnaJ